MNGINTDAVGIIRAACPASAARSIRQLVQLVAIVCQALPLCARIPATNQAHRLLFNQEGI
jgi:hypothetical protein